MRFWEKWFELRTPRFGVLTTWFFCVIAMILASLPIDHQVGERLGAGSVFGFLPVELLQSTWLYHSARVVLFLSALLWACYRAVPWSSWLTAIAFTLVWSLRMENTSHAAHIFNASNMLIFIHAMWFHFYRRPIRDSIRERRFWTSQTYPEWVFQLSLFYLCWFHTWAGLTKIQESGFDWGNGLSLQIWVYLWGAKQSPTTQLLLSSRTLTRLLQTGALIFETTAILGIFSKWFRWIVGFNLLGFYLGVLTTFIGYGFHINAILVALFLLPTRELIMRWEKSRENQTSRSEGQQIPIPQQPAQNF